jgi:hypothetical protein
MSRETGNHWNIAYSLEALTALAVAQQDMERAARLFGATETFYSQLRFLMSPLERDNHERDMAAAREALGEEVFAVLQAEGRAMTMHEAIEYALQDMND